MISIELLTTRESELDQAKQYQETVKNQLLQKLNETDATIFSINGHLAEVQHLKSLISSETIEQTSE